MTTNEAALKLARECANASGHLPGDMAWRAAREAALAAILEVTERAAVQVAIWDRVAAMSLRDMEHLS